MVTLNPKDSENPAFLLYINFKSNGFVLSIFEEKDPVGFNPAANLSLSFNSAVV